MMEDEEAEREREGGEGRKSPDVKGMRTAGRERLGKKEGGGQERWGEGEGEGRESLLVKVEEGRSRSRSRVVVDEEEEEGESESGEEVSVEFFFSLLEGGIVLIRKEERERERAEN